MKRQNDLLIEQHDLRLRPILEPYSSASQHFNLDLQNHGFERGYVWLVRIQKHGDATSETGNIAGLVNSLVDTFGVRSLLSSPVSANDTTPRLLKVGEGYPVLDFSMDFGKAKGEDLLRALRRFYDALAEYEVIADTTDLRNRQPEAFTFDLRRLIARIDLPQR